MSKIDFKEFVKENPRLATFVNRGEMSWQKFYEMYDMYGSENEVWNPYLKELPKETVEPSLDFMKYLKNINLDAVQESVTSIQRVLGVLGDLVATKEETKTNYEPKPIYKHFDD